MSHDVFISYSSTDKNIANAMVHILEESKIKCWIAPRDIESGQSWPASIPRAIANSKAMVIITSEKSSQSDEVNRELTLAARYGKNIHPFRIEDVSLLGEMEYFLCNVHWIDALTEPRENQIKELALRLGKELDIESQDLSNHKQKSVDFDKVIDVYEKIQSENIQDNSRDLYVLNLAKGDFNLSIYRFQEADDEYNKGFDIINSLLKRDPTNYIYLLDYIYFVMRFGDVYVKKGNIYAGNRCYVRAIEKMESNLNLVSSIDYKRILSDYYLKSGLCQLENISISKANVSASNLDILNGLNNYYLRRALELKKELCAEYPSNLEFAKDFLETQNKLIFKGITE